MNGVVRNGPAAAPAADEESSFMLIPAADIVDDEERRAESGAAVRFLPLSSVVVGLGTYVACRVIAVVEGTYLGGLPVPFCFFSDTGRDVPAYYVFVGGAMLSFFPSCVSFWLLYRRMLGWLNEMREPYLRPVVRWLERLCKGGCLLGLAAQPFLLTLTIFDTSRKPNIHQTAADTFFTLSVGALFCIGTFFNILSVLYPGNEHLRTSARVKTGVFMLFVMGFIVYIPLGVAIACPARLLSVGECIEVEHLPADYCENNPSPMEPGYTLFWTYKDCPVAYSLRTLGQFVCIVTLLSYISTFCLDLRPELMYLKLSNEGERVREILRREHERKPVVGSRR